MKEDSPLVQQACGEAYVSIFEACAPNKEEKRTIDILFYERLESFILDGSDLVVQEAACNALSQLVKHLIDKDHSTLSDFLCPKIIGLFINTR
jgi:hypothetical protein